MVVSYPSGAEGSIWSFFTVTPRIIFARRGSILPQVLPQVTLAVVVSLVAREWNPVQDLGENVATGFSTIGFLLCFLIVFKTQSAYNQWWEAMGHVEGILFLSRSLAMATCTMLPWPNDKKRVSDHGLAAEKPVRLFARKVVRLLLVHYFVLVEYFQRTGENATKDPVVMDALRDRIAKLTGPREFSLLYCPDDHGTPASKSHVKCARPMVLIYWIQIAICRCGEIHELAPPKYAIFEKKLNEMMRHFWEMNKIDKIQFPLPYAQVMKITCLIFVYSLPFILYRDMGDLTPLVVGVVALGFYGLDEVAEILESPFGNDANDIDLEDYGLELMADLELIYHGRDLQMDAVFTDENELSFKGLIGTLNEKQRRKHDYRVMSGKLQGACSEGKLRMSSTGEFIQLPKSLTSSRGFETLCSPAAVSDMEDLS